MSTDPGQNQLIKLTLLLQLQKRARQADREELPFVMVNETSGLFSYKQAVLWLGSPRPEAFSGVAAPDPNGPMTQWLKKLSKSLPSPDGGIMAFSSADIPGRTAGDWEQYAPPHGLLLELASPENEAMGRLVFFRHDPWQDAELHVAGYLAEAYGHALTYSARKTGGKLGRGKGKKAWIALALALAALFIPVRDSVLTPAEVVARNPVLIRSPLDGVVDEILTSPNAQVKPGDILFKLDEAGLRSKALVAQKAMEAATADYRQAQQRALSDPGVKTRLGLLKAALEQRREELKYARQLLARVEVASPVAGVVILDNPDQWPGRPVAQGQRIMTVADPDEVCLRIMLDAGHAMPTQVGDQVEFFPNIAPESPLDASLSFISYQATPRPGRDAAFRLRAGLDREQELPRVGLQGTAKIYGPMKTLGQVVFRKPIALIRQWLSL